MAERRARFEIVRTAAGWHARFRAANGAVVWTTEVYKRRRAAVASVETFGFPVIRDKAILNGFPIEVREVDER